MSAGVAGFLLLAATAVIASPSEAGAATATAGGVKVKSLRVAPERLDTSRDPARVRVSAVVKVRGSEERVGVNARLVRIGGSKVIDEVPLGVGRAGQGHGPHGGRLVLPARSRRGSYAVSLLVFSTGGKVAFSAAKLQRAGFDNRVRQVGSPRGAEPPGLKDVEIVPDSINTDGDQAQLEILVRAFDLHRVEEIKAQVAGPSPDLHFETAAGKRDIVEGDAVFGTWALPGRVPRWSPPGRWTITSIEIKGDSARRVFDTDDLARRGFDTGFDQTGAGDSVAPVVREFDMQPTSYDTSADPYAVLDYWLVAEDDRSGVTLATVQMWAPGASAPVATSLCCQPTAGTGNRGVWSGSIPAPTAPGTYGLSVVVQDAAGNGTVVDSSQLAAAGFTSSIRNGP